MDRTEISQLPPPHPLADADRCTANINVYHEQHKLQPTHATAAFSSMLSQGGEAAYTRRVQVGEEWLPLDCGWLRDDAGAVLLTNQTREDGDRVPTDAQREAVDAAVVEVCSGGTPWKLPPRGGFVFGIPVDVSMLRLRCVCGVATVGVHVCPR
jgi:hypothetical protein